MNPFGRVRNYVGEAMMAVGLLHTTAAWSSYVDQWVAIRNDGVWNTVEVAGTGLRGEALWFAVAGVSYLFTGLIARAHLRATGTLPMGFAIGTAALALGICVAMPASGAWMALACGVWAVLVALGGGGAAAREPMPEPRRRFRPEDLVV